MRGQAYQYILNRRYRREDQLEGVDRIPKESEQRASSFEECDDLLQERKETKL